MDNKKAITLFNYIGGKTWLRKQLRQEVESVLLKNHLTTYVEPFAGGLGAFLNVYDILLENNIKNIVLNDINKKLIGFYNIVLNSPESLVSSYMILEEEFEKTIPTEAYSLHKTKDKVKLKVLLKEAEAFFKKVRNDFNESKDILDTATHLLFLQNHCFNGVYRENLKGYYNTPFNWEAKVFTEEKIKDKILIVNNIFKKFEIEFTSNSFEDMSFNKHSLYYVDPPYLNEVIIENKYSKYGFSFEMQQSLISSLDGTTFIYSNHYNELLINEFKKHNLELKIQKIPRKNIISASTESRKEDKIEVLISSVI